MKKIFLNEDWQFARLPDGVFPVASESDWKTVTLPHTWYSDGDQYRGLAVYCKTVAVDPAWQRLYLEFDGADQVCHVFINGEFIGEHRGGYARFRFPVPEKALENGKLRIDVYLDNSLNPQVSPSFGDFTVFGGLYRSVSLLAVGEDHFDYCYYGTNGIIARAGIEDDGTGLITLESHVRTGKPDAVIVYTLSGPDGRIAAGGTVPAGDITRLTVSEPVLWNGQKGAGLYQLQAALMVNGTAVDETDLRLGFRSITINPDEGLRLNGERIKLRGVAMHQDRAFVFSAVTEQQIDKDFGLLREIGANAVRLSHYQHAQHTYDCCDEYGFLAWAEIPMLKMTEDAALLSNAQEQLKELILQNIHHPSVFCWGIQNEIGMFRDEPFMHKECRALASLAKSCDPCRLVTAANLYNVKFSSPLNAITDMVGYNLYFGWYYGKMQDYSKYLDAFHEAQPKMPIGISEYGVDANPRLHAEEPEVRDYSEEYQSLFHETVYPIFESKGYLWGSFVWNMFDFSSDRRNEGGVKFLNAKGLVSHDRTLRKDAFYYYKAVWSQEPFVHICSRRFVRRCRETIDVKVYTNQPEVTLAVNGKEVERSTNNGNGTVIFHDIVLQPGENHIRALYGGCSDECIFEHVEFEEESYRLSEEAGGMVRNWFLSDDDTVKEGCYSIMDTAEDLLNAARPVLEKYVPNLVAVLDQDAIPLGLSMKSILARELKDDPDAMVCINDALHKIKKEF